MRFGLARQQLAVAVGLAMHRRVAQPRRTLLIRYPEDEGCAGRQPVREATPNLPVAARCRPMSRLKARAERPSRCEFPARERDAIRAALLWSVRRRGRAGRRRPDRRDQGYQKRNKAKVTGLLTEAEREALLADAKDARRRIWLERSCTDPATGVRARPAGQMVPRRTPGAERHALVVAARRRPDPDLPHQDDRLRSARCSRSEKESRRTARSSTS